MARAIMLQGTGSDVGKSLLVAGLARLFARAGMRVRPFKPQNMSNNAAVTADGGEIGRAQALQARAAGVPPSVHMNPVLLKPQGGNGAQVVVHGRIRGSFRAAQYQALKPQLLAPVLESFARLKAEADIVLVEGAGSAAEVNLRRGDIANMGFARAAGVPVVIVGDIDRGGVIASLVGTARLLEPEDAATVAGFIVNRFRGDPSLFDAGTARIVAETGWRSFGLVPHTAAARKLPAEDALALRQAPRRKDGARIVVAVPTLPSIANFDDLDPLEAEPDVAVVRIDPGEALPGTADLVILPGSKATLSDLSVLRASGLDIDILAHVRRGGHLLGICGGYQMMCRTLADPSGIEGVAGEMAGLGLVDADTVMTGEKTLLAVAGRSFAGAPLRGYEMHVGRTRSDGRPFAHVAAEGEAERADGVAAAGGTLVGTYVHGLFCEDAQRADWIARLGGRAGGIDYEAGVEEALDALADHLATHLDIGGILAAAR